MKLVGHINNVPVFAVEPGVEIIRPRESDAGLADALAIRAAKAGPTAQILVDAGALAELEVDLECANRFVPLAASAALHGVGE